MRDKRFAFNQYHRLLVSCLSQAWRTYKKTCWLESRKSSLLPGRADQIILFFCKQQILNKSLGRKSGSGDDEVAVAEITPGDPLELVAIKRYFFQTSFLRYKPIMTDFSPFTPENTGNVFIHPYCLPAVLYLPNK